MLRHFAEEVISKASSTSRRSKLLLLAGALISVGIFEWVSRLFKLPQKPAFGGTLLAQPSPLISFIILGVTLLGTVLASTLIAGSIRFDAGLLCGVIGMASISTRSGTMGDVLREGADKGATIFIHLALELVLIYALVAIAWSMLWRMHASGLLKGDEFRDGVEDTDEPVHYKAAALVMQVGVTALLILLLGQSEAKAQVMLAILLAALVGACAAYFMYPISPSPWLWMGPMIVGVVGYALAYFSVTHDEQWKTGRLDFALAALARPLPLDYATAGPAGAILGYWLGRKWHRERMEQSVETHEAHQ